VIDTDGESQRFIVIDFRMGTLVLTTYEVESMYNLYQTAKVESNEPQPTPPLAAHRGSRSWSESTTMPTIKTHAYSHHRLLYIELKDE
jgi:hypothetical protein